MSEHTCPSCGSAVEQSGRGRPRIFCLACSPRKRPVGPSRDRESPAVCSVEECGASTKAKGLCGRHYQQLRSLGSPAPSHVACGSCGTRFAPRTARQLYCSNPCANKASYERRRQALTSRNRATSAALRSATVKTCPACGEGFTPERTLRQKFCTRKCAYRFYQDDLTRTCASDDCDRPVRARGMCHMHYRAARYAAGEVKYQWTPERKAAWLARAATKRGAGDSGKFTVQSIYERDRWICGICDGSIDPDLAWPDPKSASIDHVVPLSLGGDHLPENVQAAHLRCNISKGNRVA